MSSRRIGVGLFCVSIVCFCSVVVPSRARDVHLDLAYIPGEDLEHARARTHARTHKCTHIHKYTHTHIHTHTHTHTQNIQSHTRVHFHTHIHIIQMYVCIYIYIFVTHPHAHVPKSIYTYACTAEVSGRSCDVCMSRNSMCACVRVRLTLQFLYMSFHLQEASTFLEVPLLHSTRMLRPSRKPRLSSVAVPHAHLLKAPGLDPTWSAEMLTS